MGVQFVGRRRELALLAGVLAAHGPKVAYLRGMGGIGKSSLIREFVRTHPDVRFASYDATALPTPLQELARRVRGGVVIVDGLDQAPGRAEIIWREVLPRLAADVRLVLVSREPPPLGWTAELGPGRFLDVALDSLDDADAAALLAHWRVGEVDRRVLLELCHGHPLLLVLASQVGDANAFVENGLEGAPELLVALVEALGAMSRGPALDGAFTVCAIARRTTEPLLREVLQVDDAIAVFDALRRQSWVHLDARGLYPHDLVRDALRAHAKWRDRPTYDRWFRAVATVAIEAVRRGGGEAVADVVFLLADNPAYRLTAHRLVVAPGPMTETDDFALVRRLLEPHLGAHALDWVRTWFEAGLCRLAVMHGEDGQPTEAFATLDDRLLRGGEPTGDPVVDAARELLAGLSLREGAGIVFSRAGALLIFRRPPRSSVDRRTRAAGKAEAFPRPEGVSMSRGHRRVPSPSSGLLALVACAGALALGCGALDSLGGGKSYTGPQAKPGPSSGSCPDELQAALAQFDAGLAEIEKAPATTKEAVKQLDKDLSGLRERTAVALMKNSACKAEAKPKEAAMRDAALAYRAELARRALDIGQPPTARALFENEYQRDDRSDKPAYRELSQKIAAQYDAELRAKFDASGAPGDSGGDTKLCLFSDQPFAKDPKQQPKFTTHVEGSKLNVMCRIPKPASSYQVDVEPQLEMLLGIAEGTIVNPVKNLVLGAPSSLGAVQFVYGEFDMPPRADFSASSRYAYEVYVSHFHTVTVRKGGGDVQERWKDLLAKSTVFWHRR